MGDMADYYNDSSWDPEDWDDDPPPKQHQAGCQGHKVLRVNKQTGEEFWGCSWFPRCRWSEVVDV
jgi:hypothetical protein